MRRVLSGVLAAALVTTVGLQAQGRGRGAGAGTPPPTPAADIGKTINVDGCVQNAPAPTGGGAPATKFVLAAKPIPGGGPNGPRYLLDGDEKAIAPHLNHVVEVRGLVQGTAAEPAPAGGRGGGTPTLTMKVEWVKMVAATCS